MASFDPLHPKNSAIIEMLAEKKILPTAELRRLLATEREIKISVANFYKIIAKMVKHQMLVKTGDQITLNLTWATHVYRYAELMRKQKKSSPEEFKHFKPGEQRVFSAESLDKIDPIWTHLVLYLFTQETEPMIYVYEAHPWYLLGRPATERRLYESCYLQGKTIRVVYGNDTFLDRYAMKLNKNTPHETAVAVDIQFPKEGYTVWVCGQYFIECTFAEVISQYFANFFATTQTAKDFDLKTFSSIFNIKIPVELKVSRDRGKAARLVGAMKKFFGG